MSQDWKNREPDRDQLERHLEHELKKRGLTRRDLLRGGMAMASALGLGALFAACGGGGDSGESAATGGGSTTSTGAAGGGAAAFTGTLRVIGIGTDTIEPVRVAGEKALGFKLAFDVSDGATLRQKVLTQPESFDVYSDETAGADIVWASGNLMPIPRSAVTAWDNYTMLYRAGRIDPANTSCTLGDGDAAFRKQYTTEQGDAFVTWADSETGETGDTPEPEWLTMIGNVFNCDTIGYNAEVLTKEPDQVSWGELFNPNWSGRVALLNDPNIGMQDAGIAAESLGLMSFGDMGNMTREEIDGIVKILIDLKQKGQFRAFWTTFDESVNLMSAGEVVVESMWSPAVSLLQSQGFPCRYAAPPEGFRGWWGGNFISKKAADDPALLQAAIDYSNWWLSGEPGAIMMRQGYYSPLQETSRQYVEPFEWDYWIEGKPATQAIPNPFGEETAGIPVGTVRDGGSLKDRVCHYRSWNSTMDEQEYLVQKWNEFIAA